MSSNENDLAWSKCYENNVRIEAFKVFAELDKFAPVEATLVMICPNGTNMKIPVSNYTLVHCYSEF